MENLNYLSSLSESKAKEFSFVLSAIGIPHRIEKTSNGFSLQIERDFEESAIEQITLYEEENKKDIKLKELSYSFNLLSFCSAVTLFVLFFVFQNFLFSFGYLEYFVENGNASSLDIIRGEIWRCATAITLHIDIVHFLSNAFMGGVILYFLFRNVGTGIGLFLFFLSGFLGNLFSAFVYLTEFHSIGSSGAIFGSFGVLSALRHVNVDSYRKGNLFITVGSAIAFLLLFGMGEYTDIFGHIFGLLSGLILGFGIVPLYHFLRNKKIVQATFGVLSFAIVILSWKMTL